MGQAGTARQLLELSPPAAKRLAGTLQPPGKGRQPPQCCGMAAQSWVLLSHWFRLSLLPSGSPSGCQIPPFAPACPRQPWAAVPTAPHTGAAVGAGYLASPSLASLSPGVPGVPGIPPPWCPHPCCPCPWCPHPAVPVPGVPVPGVPVPTGLCASRTHAGGAVGQGSAD